MHSQSMMISQGNGNGNWFCVHLAHVAASTAVQADRTLSRFSASADAAIHESGAVKATMDAGGQMQVKSHNQPRHHHIADGATATVKKMFPFYHTTDEIRSEAVRLSQRCGGALNVTTIKEGDVSIDVFTVRRASAKPVNRVFILFGEHSRELISPESGLYFLRGLCGEVKLDTSSLPALIRSDISATDVLEDSEFQMVLNSNPRSRRLVENGNFCLRTNPNGVDLNRNWDEEWEKDTSSMGSETNPGAKPFSEPETRIFKKLVTQYAPTTFLTVHSGTRGMYMPWAYDMKHLANYNGPSMMEVLKDLDKDHCECPFGAAGKEVRYPCPGTCLDYAYAKLNTPFAFAFEIYTSPDRDSDLKGRWEEKLKSGGAQLLQQDHHLGHPHFNDLFTKHSSDFVGSGSSKSSLRVKSQHSGVASEGGAALLEEPDTSCFEMFNPPTQQAYDKVVKNWAEAYVQMSTMIAKKVRAGQVPKRAAAAPTPVQEVMRK